MSSLPSELGKLAAIAGFSAAELLALLRDNPALPSLKRAAVCAVAAWAVAWVCGQLALSVMRDGLSKANDEENAGGVS